MSNPSTKNNWATSSMKASVYPPGYMWRLTQWTVSMGSFVLWLLIGLAGNLEDEPVWGQGTISPAHTVLSGSVFPFLTVTCSIHISAFGSDISFLPFPIPTALVLNTPSLVAKCVPNLCHLSLYLTLLSLFNLKIPVSCFDHDRYPLKACSHF